MAMVECWCLNARLLNISHNAVMLVVDLDSPESIAVIQNGDILVIDDNKYQLSLIDPCDKIVL